ncbi:hypothetical protein Fcan01_28719 [Folsomia candida]|uniref:Uncharacterized protein n=1 Tax=Folsomia candida TaxID=158441 RepID=A0A226CWV6_FOLCA|nr:hypothetical protein Fcan01_28719 [Folsomia candida]
MKVSPRAREGHPRPLGGNGERVEGAPGGWATLPLDDLTPRPHYAQRGAYWTSRFWIIWSLAGEVAGPRQSKRLLSGTDFGETLTRILYLRECVSPLVKDFVTFHIFFDTRHVPSLKSHRIRFLSFHFELQCTFPTFGDNIVTYKKAKKLPYPVNVARNVAHFLEMIRLNDSNLQRPNPKVFVLSIFEVEANVSVQPRDKRNCCTCWETSPQSLSTSTSVRLSSDSEGERVDDRSSDARAACLPRGKRHKPYHHWEPIYIGTKFDPLYDERLSWEGRSDKMTQGYVLCVLDYEFHILDNAFLVHRPGSKGPRSFPRKIP